MKGFKLFIVVLALSTLAACSATPTLSVPPAQTPTLPAPPAQFTYNTLAVATSAVELDRSYEAMASMIQTHFGDFSPEEQASLLSIDQALRAIRAQLHLKAGNNTEKLTSLITLAELKNLYFSARQSYTQAKAIVAPKLASLAPAERSQVEIFDREARALDEALLPLTSASATPADITPVVQELLTTAAMVAKLVLLIKA